MTSTRYLVARFAQAFGYYRKNQRMADAASEMHLLREAEAFLGNAIWNKVEDIEALSVEYWNLRKLIKERDIALAKLSESQTKLDQAHEERVLLLNNITDNDQELLEKRLALLTDLEQISSKRDKIIAEAREVRRIHVGLKMKLEVLTKESNQSSANPEEITKVKTRLIELKKRFSELKAERIEIGASIEKGDATIDIIDEQLRKKRQKRRDLAAEIFQIISKVNKNVSTLRAESSSIDTQMRLLYAEIGRYVSRNTKHDPLCAAAVEKHQGLTDVMRALRRSISLNHRLSGIT